jgi:hypothetical protein
MWPCWSLKLRPEGHSLIRPVFPEIRPIAPDGISYILLEDQQSKQVRDGHNGYGNIGQVPYNGCIGKGGNEESYDIDDPVYNNILGTKEVSNSSASVIGPLNGLRKGK